MPSKPAVPPHPQAGPTEARIDDADDAAGHPEVQWQVVPNYQDAEEGEAEWTFKARDQESLDKALKLTQDAIEHAETMSHVGFLTLPDRSSFPRIVGGKGSNVARLRNETGADITVSREDTTITIIGTSVWAVVDHSPDIACLQDLRVLLKRLRRLSSKPQRITALEVVAMLKNIICSSP